MVIKLRYNENINVLKSNFTPFYQSLRIESIDEMYFQKKPVVSDMTYR